MKFKMTMIGGDTYTIGFRCKSLREFVQMLEETTWLHGTGGAFHVKNILLVEEVE